MWLNLDPERAAEYSFLLAIPVILGAASLQLPDLTLDTGAIGAGPLLVGFASALMSGIFANRVLVRLLRQGRFHRFSPYGLVLGLITLGWVVIA
jgi:undecaprenyl-diphosphatase